MRVMQMMPTVKIFHEILPKPNYHNLPVFFARKRYLLKWVVLLRQILPQYFIKNFRKSGEISVNQTSPA